MDTIGLAIDRLLLLMRSRIDLLKDRGEEGLTTAEWVVLVAAVVAMAIAAAGVIATKVSTRANNVNI